ncbi:MAG: LysR family transcriptional regulator [Clostridia bacterium]|nr:LysR family transcriptional regulator [Clostridia bacterium]
MVEIEKYVISVYINRSFSLAASELFISQPALSAAIGRHEKSLGFEIFDRSVLPISLTPKGKIYIEYLDEKQKSENEMKRKIRMLSEEGQREVSVGAYAYSGYSILAEISKEFSKKRPEVKVRLDMGSIGHLTNLSEKLKRHELDMMLNYDFDQKEHDVIPILTERLIIAMRRDLDGADKIKRLALPRERIINGEVSEDELISDASVFRDIRFLEYSAYSDTRRRMKLILGEYKRANYYVENARQVDMHNRLMRVGIGAVMTTDFHLKNRAFDNNDLLFFAINSPYAKRTLYMIKQKGYELSNAANTFIETAIELFAGGAQ